MGCSMPSVLPSSRANALRQRSRTKMSALSPMIGLSQAKKSRVILVLNVAFPSGPGAPYISISREPCANAFRIPSQILSEPSTSALAIRLPSKDPLHCR